MSMSRRTDHIQIARVTGIPIYLHFGWLIIFGLIVWTLSTGYFPAQEPDLPTSSYWAQGLVASLLFFVSLLLHELGHAVVARRQGLRTRWITLLTFGGVALLEKDPRGGQAELRISLDRRRREALNPDVDWWVAHAPTGTTRPEAAATPPEEPAAGE
jgi:Zn-dependent protease